MTTRREHLLLIVLFGILGSLSATLAFQQKFFVLWDKTCIYQQGQTVITFSRTRAWLPSLLSAILALGICWYIHVSSRVRERLLGVALAVWSLLYLFLFLVGNDYTGGVVYPTEEWHLSPIAQKMILDPSYALGWFLALSQSVLGVWLCWLPRSRILATPYPSCHSCGYNLTGNISGRCPECGQRAQDITERAGRVSGADRVSG
jgi:hypothetical protein